MIERAEDVDAYVSALLDITESNLFEAVFLVCKDIELKDETTNINY